MNEVIEISKTTVYTLLGVIALLEVVVILFQSQLFEQKRELRKLLKSSELKKPNEHSSIR